MDIDMDAKTTPVLCGGTFFVLLLEAAKQWRNRRTSLERTEITETDLLLELITVFANNYQKDSDIKNIRSAVSDFKRCKVAVSQRFLLHEQVRINAFDKAVKETYEKSWDAMSSIVDKYIDVEEKGEWLIGALIDLICEDPNIHEEATFILGYDGYSVHKSELRTKTEFNIASFLLGVWHYIILYIKDNSVGEATYNKWFGIDSREDSKMTKKHAAKKWDSDIGQKTAQLIILLPSSDIKSHLIKLGKSSTELAVNNAEKGDVFALENPEIGQLSNSTWSEKDRHSNLKIFSVQLTKTDYFVGRSTILAQLSKGFKNNSATTPIIQTLCGLDGFGKTQLALKYVFDNLDSYDAICWVECVTGEALAKSCAYFLYRVEDFSELSWEARFNHWFQTNENWLLVFDDVNEAVNINHIIPKIGQGHIILITCEASKSAISIEPFNETEAKDFLINRTGIRDELNAKKIAIRLGCLPLALEQAAAYILALETDLAGFYGHLCEHNLKVLGKNKPLENYKRNVHTVWQIVLDKLSADAKKLLYCFAYMSADHLMLAWLTDYVKKQQTPQYSDSFAFLEEIFNDFIEPQVPPELTALLGDDIACNDAIIELKKFSLVSKKDNETLMMHSLLQEVIRDGIINPSYLLSVWEMLRDRCDRIDLIYDDYRIAISLQMAQPIISNVKALLDYRNELEKNQKVCGNSSFYKMGVMQFQLYSFIAQLFDLRGCGEKKNEPLEEADRYYEAACHAGQLLFGEEIVSSAGSFTLIQERHRRMRVNLRIGRGNTATQLYEESKKILVNSINVNPGMVENALENYGDLWKNHGYFEKAKEAYELALNCKIEKHRESLQIKIADCRNG